MSSIISSVTDGASQTLASSLIKDFDSNGDGLFSASEFANFLGPKLRRLRRRGNRDGEGDDKR
jgi:hypothetical protein